MKAYPSIKSSRDRTIPLGEPCVAFKKYDGSNLRWEWRKKQGWYKFGTRHRLFGLDEAPYNQAIPIFMDKLGPKIEKIVSQLFPGTIEIIAFTEFLGKNSFAGSHILDEPKFLKLIDINLYKVGLITPRRFMRMFGHLEFAPEVVYDGNLNREFIEDIRNRDLSFGEGVVCKGIIRKKQMWMVKIKTNAYIEKLKRSFGAEWDKYAE